VRRFCLIFGLVVLGFFARAAFGDTFQLTTGKTLTGEVLAASGNESGIQIKVGEGEYERVPWTSFSQEDLKKFAQNKKLEPFVEPFIEVSQEEKMKKTEVNIKQPPRVARPAPRSLFGALFSSGPGLFIVLLLYAANIFAAFEIAIFRAQPVGLVCGISAVLPVIGPIIYLAKPMNMPASQESWEPAPAASAPDALNPMQGEAAMNPMQGEVTAPGGLKIAHATPEADKAEKAT